MDALTEFFAMGRYGHYVWPSYGLAALVMGWLWLSTLRRLRKNQAALDAMTEQRPEKNA